MNTGSPDDWLKASPLYREAQAEREEILKHKWYESEKKGYDIGMDLAKVDWTMKHGGRWHRERRQKGCGLAH